MNYKALFSNIIVLTALCLPATLEAEVTPYDLPAGISSVDPPQGLVDLSNNANPLGVTQISVVFESENLEANPNAVGYVVMYKDGSDDVYDSVPATVATVDQYNHQYGSVIFEHKHTAEGIYTISIPEGTWLVDGNNSPAINLIYEIQTETTITPAAGIVEQLDKVTITFNTAEQVSLRVNNIVASAMGSTNDCKVEVSVDGNVAELSISNYDGSELSPATYTVFVPAKTFKLTTGDAVDYNKDIVLQYTIPAFPKQPISPAEGEVTGFKEFIITPNDDLELTMVDDKSRSYIYAVDENGELAADPTYKVSAKYSEGNILLYVIDSNWEAVEEPVEPALGRYALVLAQALFCGTYNGSFESSAPFIYYYDVVSTNGVKTVSVSSETDGAIYSLYGVKIAQGSEALRQLPAGIYIYDGHKIALTRH